MAVSRTQLAIAASVGVLLLLIFFGYLIWLNNQGPVLARSEEQDPLSGLPISISLNPLRDRTSEHVANKYLDAMRDGKCSRNGKKTTAGNTLSSSVTRKGSIPCFPGSWWNGKMRRHFASCTTADAAAATPANRKPIKSFSR
jgi:hypothetical protein